MRLSRSLLARSISVALCTGLIVLVSLTTACRPAPAVTWVPGATHGAIVESGAGRASLGIWRGPSHLLAAKHQRDGLRATQDLIWAVGRPPSIRARVSFRGATATVSFGAATLALRSVAHQAIYDRDDDLADALRDAATHHSCLALTLISYGHPTLNWTQKQTGCVGRW